MSVEDLVIRDRKHLRRMEIVRPIHRDTETGL